MTPFDQEVCPLCGKDLGLTPAQRQAFAEAREEKGQDDRDRILICDDCAQPASHEGAAPPPDPLGREMIRGLSEFADDLRSGRPVTDKYRVTDVEVREDGTVTRKVYGPGDGPAQN